MDRRTRVSEREALRPLAGMRRASLVGSGRPRARVERWRAVTWCDVAIPRRNPRNSGGFVEGMTGIEPALSAWEQMAGCFPIAAIPCYHWDLAFLVAPGVHIGVHIRSDLRLDWKRRFLPCCPASMCSRRRIRQTAYGTGRCSGCVGSRSTNRSSSEIAYSGLVPEKCGVTSPRGRGDEGVRG